MKYNDIKTTANAFNPANDRVKAYLIDAITPEAYENSAETPKEKIKFLFSCFNIEYGFMIGRVGEKRALKEWLMGLPSVINTHFMNFDILNMAVELGLADADISDDDHIALIDSWWDCLPTCLLLLKDDAVNEYAEMGAE